MRSEEETTAAVRMMRIYRESKRERKRERERGREGEREKGEGTRQRREGLRVDATSRAPRRSPALSFSLRRAVGGAASLLLSSKGGERTIRSEKRRIKEERERHRRDHPQSHAPFSPQRALSAAALQSMSRCFQSSTVHKRGKEKRGTEGERLRASRRNITTKLTSERFGTLPLPRPLPSQTEQPEDGSGGRRSRAGARLPLHGERESSGRRQIERKRGSLKTASRTITRQMSVEILRSFFLDSVPRLPMRAWGSGLWPLSCRATIATAAEEEVKQYFGSGNDLPCFREHFSGRLRRRRRPQVRLCHSLFIHCRVTNHSTIGVSFPAPARSTAWSQHRPRCRPKGPRSRPRRKRRRPRAGA